MLRELTQGLLHFIYPRLCEGCGRPLLTNEQVLCLGCGLQMPETDYHDAAANDTAMRFAGRVPFTHATSYAWFTDDGLLQHLLHGLKYGGKTNIGHYLGRQLACSLQPAEWIHTVDAIVPVPLHPKKEAARGYNQSVLIAEGMGAVLDIPVLPHALARKRYTESQTQKSRAERAANMQDAFIANKSALGRATHLLLVDDVLTTGATLEACALALLAVKGVRVSIATVGIAT